MKQCLTEKQKDYWQSGRYERVDCISSRRPNFLAGKKKNGESEYRLFNDKRRTFKLSFEGTYGLNSTTI